jgi:RNA polymerase sigma factor (sigma-70 family)
MSASPTSVGASLSEIEAVYRSEAHRFVRVAVAITGDENDAWEVVQEAVAAAVRSRRSFRGDGPVSAWIWSAVVNMARSRARRRSPTVPIGSIEAEPSPDHPRPAPLQHVRRSVAALPERQRLVVFLRYYADLTYDEIATVLGVSSGTVGPTLAAALSRLRGLLEEEAP